MGFDQYHEPASDLSEPTRTFARMITSLCEEAEAIGWYEQRMSLEKDKAAKAIMENAQKEADLLKFRVDNNEIGEWEVEGLNKYDKKYRMVFREVNYDIEEIELEQS